MKKTPNKKVLHITTHLGGGIGSVLFSYFLKVKNDSSFSHSVVCLNYANKRACTIAKKLGLELFDMMYRKKRNVLKMIAKADVVVIHWWNHPLLYDFLVREQLPPSRVIIWSHVSGFYPPSVFTQKLLSYPDRFVFTTPISFQVKEVKNLPKKIKKHLSVIWSTTDISRMLKVKHKKHSGFNIGYIGTVDYTKLSHRFLSMCDKINIPNVKFIVCGGLREKEIKKEAENMGIIEKFKFTGLISASNIVKYLSVFDVFGYPLDSSHYGTCDQVLQESMGAGIVPVVFNNKMERLMVKNGMTGIIAKNESEYIWAIKMLYKNKKLRDVLSRSAREYAIENFSIEKMVKKWETIYGDILKTPKLFKKWPIKKGKISASDVFLESLGDHGKVFYDYCYTRSEDKKREAIKKIADMGKMPTWQSESKGTVHNYDLFFPGDPYLSLWSRVMKGDIDF